MLDCAPEHRSLAVVYYRVTVPAMRALHLSVTVDAGSVFEGIPLMLGLRDGCAGACLGTVDIGAKIFPNTSAAARELIVIVAARRPAIPGDMPFTLTATTVSLASNALCSAATPLTSGVPVTADCTGGGADLACAAVPTTPMRSPLYYSVHVPAGQTLRAVVSAAASASLAVLGSCAGTCTAGVAVGGGRAGELAYPNTSGADLDLIVAVGSDVVPGPVDLRVEVGPRQNNVWCASATPVASGARLIAQDVGIGVDNLASRCEPLASSGVVYYSVDVPAGQRLTVSATSVDWWPPVLRLLSTCGATSCLDSAAPPRGPNATVTHLNATAGVEHLIVAVSNGAGVPGLFDLDVTIAPP